VALESSVVIRTRRQCGQDDGAVVGTGQRSTATCRLVQFGPHMLGDLHSVVLETNVVVARHSRFVKLFMWTRGFRARAGCQRGLGHDSRTSSIYVDGLGGQTGWIAISSRPRSRFII